MWNISLHSETDGVTAAQRQLLDAITAGALIVELAGTDEAPTATGRVVQAPDGDKVFLIAQDLPSLRADQTYQVWNIKDSVPFGVALFTITADFSSADAIGISVEPSGGSVTPTTIVMLGTAG